MNKYLVIVDSTVGKSVSAVSINAITALVTELLIRAGAPVSNYRVVITGIISGHNTGRGVITARMLKRRGRAALVVSPIGESSSYICLLEHKLKKQAKVFETISPAIDASHAYHGYQPTGDELPNRPTEAEYKHHQVVKVMAAIQTQANIEFLESLIAHATGALRGLRRLQKIRSQD